MAKFCTDYGQIHFLGQVLLSASAGVYGPLFSLLLPLSPLPILFPSVNSNGS